MGYLVLACITDHISISEYFQGTWEKTRNVQPGASIQTDENIQVNGCIMHMSFKRVPMVKFYSSGSG